MYGTFGRIEEQGFAKPLAVSHRERFRPVAEEIRRKGLLWLSGSDYLLLQSVPEPTSATERLPKRPRGAPGSRFWIPVDERNDRMTGPVYDVSLTRSHPLMRVRFSSPVRIPANLAVAVDTYRAHVLGVLDDLDPSALRHLERVVRRTPLEELTAQVVDPTLGSGNRVDQPAGRPADLPPAARTILATIEASPAGVTHVLSFERRGAGELIHALIERNLVRLLPSGQLVCERQFAALCAALPGYGEAVDAARAAALWGVSTGVARQLLSVLATEGLLDRVSARHYKKRRGETTPHE